MRVFSQTVVPRGAVSGASRNAARKRIACSGVRCVRIGEMGCEPLNVFNRACHPVLLPAENHMPGAPQDG